MARARTISKELRRTIYLKFMTETGKIHTISLGCASAALAGAGGAALVKGVMERILEYDVFTVKLVKAVGAELVERRVLLTAEDFQNEGERDETDAAHTSEARKEAGQNRCVQGYSCAGAAIGAKTEERGSGTIGAGTQHPAALPTVHGNKLGLQHGSASFSPHAARRFYDIRQNGLRRCMSEANACRGGTPFSVTEAEGEIKESEATYSDPVYCSRHTIAGRVKADCFAEAANAAMLFRSQRQFCPQAFSLCSSWTQPCVPEPTF